MPPGSNSLSSDMLTFTKITENELSGSNSLSSDMLTFTDGAKSYGTFGTCASPGAKSCSNTYMWVM